MKITIFLKNPYFWLGIILVLAFVVRLYKIDNPVADWHSWRQADTAAVARNFYKEGFKPLYPKGDDMSVISDNRQPNLTRLRFVEFPIYPSLVYLGYLANGGVDEKVARLVSIFFSLGSIIFLYLITKRYLGTATALLAAFFYASLPYSIFYSRVILPEPSLIFFSLGMVLFLDRFIWEGKKSNLCWSIFFTACAFLTKPTAGFFLIPLIYSYYQKERKFFFPPKKYFLLLLGLLPFVGWRIWISQAPDSIPAAAWLLNGDGIRGKLVFWQWILDDRFRREILGLTGVIIFFFGVLIKPKPKEGWFLHLLVLSAFVYLLTFATGNVRHDYYQTLIIPALSIFLARGVIIFARGEPFLLPKLLLWPILVLFFLMIYYSTWNEIRGLYQINNYSIVEAGMAADKILPSNATVLAPYQGDTAFLYQTNRKGFPIIFTDINDMKNRFGLTHMVSVAKDKDTAEAMKKYHVLVDTPTYVIIDLTKEQSK